MDIRTRVTQAVQSGKVDPYISHQYGALPEGTDLTTAQVAFLARGVRAGLQVEGSLGAIENIYSVLIPWARFPDLVADPNLLYFEASR